MQKQRILLDTNVLLSESEILYENPKRYAICLTTLRELDKLKRRPDLNFVARRAIKAIYHNLDKLYIDLNEPFDENNLTNDEKIILSAKENKFVFQSEDIGAIVLAKTRFKVDVKEEEKSEELNYNYTGYKEKYISDEKIWKSLKTGDEFSKKVISKFSKELKLNEHYILYNEKRHSDFIILRKNNKNKTEIIDIKAFKNYIEQIGIKHLPLDPVQWVAFSNITAEDVPLVVIEGKLGTGKTLLAMMGALSRTKHMNISLYKNIYITRPPLPIDKRYENGFLPGDMENKLSPWMLGFKSNLSFLYQNLEEDKVSEIFKEYFKMVSLEHIQGASIHDSIFIVDEYQLLDENMLKQILSRIAQGSKIILLGDPKGQNYNLNRGHEGFRVLWKHIQGSKYLSYTKLDKIYRSELAKFVEEIFN